MNWNPNRSILLLAAVVVIGVSALLTMESRLTAVMQSDQASIGAGRYKPCNEPYSGVPSKLTGNRLLPASAPCAACLGVEGNRHNYPCQKHNIKNAGNSSHPYQGIEAGSNRWIRMACAEAHKSVAEGGGPFGAVIVQVDDATNQVIRYWRSRNQVTKSVDPTAHAEVTAVRMAAADLGVYNLGEIRRNDPQLRLPQTCETSHCEIYSSCEPCPMCYAAIRWARIDTLVFGATRFDAAVPGVDFSDLELYEELSTPYQDRHRFGLRVLQATTDNSLDAFNLWKNSDKVEY
ncbi:MAG: nucleoside deaminase [Pirellulales bacterium]|nr:nucleoside deaminase [Pirellulales bacterium]